MDSSFEKPPRPLTLGGRTINSVGRTRIYVCGVTPYHVTHLGHAATFVWTDAAVRVLRAVGTTVELARNVTDVDETLLAEARRRGERYDWLAATQRFAFDRTMTTLGLPHPDHEPTARRTVSQVVQLAQALLDRGAAYVRGNSVYARTAAAARRAGVDDETAVRLSEEYGDEPGDPAKEHPLDTAVWRGATEGEPQWPSPWGGGRPGWHAQCAAMVLGTYGASIDIHAGGADLAYPHHATEAHLAETVTGVTPFARAWLRPGTVRLGDTKMAKSTGNLVLADELLRDYSAGAVRFLCLNRPWRESWTFTRDALDVAAGQVADLYSVAGRPNGESAVEAVEAALLADLDVPAAYAVALDAGGAAARRLVDVLQLH